MKTDLKATQQWFRSIIESSMDMIIAVDNDRKIIEFNKAAEKTFGYRAEEVLGKHVNLLYADKKQGEEVYKTTLRDRQNLREILNRRKNGEIFPSLLSASWLVDSQGRQVGLMGVSRDITDRKRGEAHLLHTQKMEIIGALAGKIAHEINNRLTSALGYADLSLSKLDKDTKVHQYLKSIRKNVEFASSVTQQLLDITGKRNGQPEDLVLNDLIRSMDEILGTALGQGIRLRLRLSSNGTIIRADPRSIEHVIMILALNARDAMPRGGKLLVKTSRKRVDSRFKWDSIIPHGSYIMLEVSDTGTGMSPEVKERIFEPFFTTKDVSISTGLGLTLVQKVVDESDGTISVASKEGKGTKIRILFPEVGDSD